MGECAPLLKNVSLFRNLSDDQLAGLEPSLSLVQERPGRMLCRRGDPSDCFFIIISGKVTVVINSDGGEDTYIDLGEGEFFGEIGMIRGAKRSADAVTAEASELVKVDKLGFDTLMSEDLLFADIMMEATRERLGQLNQVNPEAAAAPTDGTGRVGVFFSARGGAGTTCLATNFAKKVRDLSKKKVVLLDADLEFGACHILLNQPNQNTLIDGVDGDEVDPLDVQQAVVQTEAGVDLLPCPARTEDAMRFNPAQLRGVVAALQAAYDYVIVDTRSTLNDATLTMLECADDVFCVMENDIVSIARTIRTIDLLSRAGFDTDRFRIVVNKLQDVGYSIEEMERDMKREILFRVDVDTKPVLDSINSGKLLVSALASSKAAVDISNGAREYLLPLGDAGGAAAQEQKAERGFSLWSLFGRG